MEISFILSSLWLSGGVRVVIQYANRLAKRGHHISFVIPEGTVDSHLGIEIDPSTRILQAKTTLTKGMNPIKLGLLAWEMAKVTPKSDVIIATHTPTTSVSMIAGKLFRKGKIVWFYQDYQEMFEKRPLEGWLLRNAARWHDLSLTISEACVQELNTFSNTKIINVGEGLDTQDVFHPIPNARLLFQVNPDQKIILTIADSRPRKGLADFLKAVEKVHSSLPDIVLWIVSKENMEIQTNVPIVFYYRPSPTDFARLYSACDLFVSASWYESFGLPPLEAMACGAAVVTTDSRGIREYAVDGENCLIVPVKNPDMLAEGMLYLLSQPDLVDKLRRNGPGTAAKFDWERATDRFEAALNEVNRRH